jgi:hypothetical protein
MLSDIADHLDYSSAACEMYSCYFHSVQINKASTEQMVLEKKLRGLQIPAIHAPCTFFAFA